MTTQLALAEPTPLHASAWPRWSPDGEAVALLTARAQVTIFGGDLGRKLKEFKPLADDIQVCLRRLGSAVHEPSRKLTGRCHVLLAAGRQHLEWSPDGSLLMCGQYKANTVTVLHAVGDKGVMAVITDPTFRCVAGRPPVASYTTYLYWFTAPPVCARAHAAFPRHAGRRRRPTS